VKRPVIRSILGFRPGDPTGLRRTALSLCVVLLAVAIVAFVGAGTKQTVHPSGAAHTHKADVPGLNTVEPSELAGFAESMSDGTTDNLPADCIPNPSGPPGAPYELGIVGTVTNGELTAGPATVADITAKFCGIVTVVGAKPPCGATGKISSPQDGQIFGTLSAALTLIPGMKPVVPFVAHPGVINGTFSCGPSNNGLLVTLDATVSGTTGLFGLSCTIGPLTLQLSGLITGPLQDTTGVLAGNDFAVPAITPSPTCAGQVPASLDQLAGLPIKPGGANAKLYVTASLYQPAPSA
jgi:hypothetical protein